MQEELEHSQQSNQILDLGKLSDRLWPGKISVAETTIDIEHIAESLESYYVPTKHGARTRCIDGRHDPHLDEANLGAQVPGGAAGAALAYRLGVDKDDLTRGTFLNDAEAMIESYVRHDLTPGGHRDNLEHDHGVGCGAIDSVQTILDHMTNPQLVEDHKRLVKLLMAETFRRDDYLRVMGAGLVLESRSAGYFDGRERIIDILEERCPGTVSVLEGQHAEGLVIVNLVPNTTLASNRFANEIGMQAFGYDMWRSRELAQILMPLPSQVADRDRFVMARVMLTVAALMALTDGSLTVLLRVTGE